MAINVIMYKCTQLDKTIYYRVEVPDDNQTFYIGINTIEKNVSYYGNSQFRDPLKVVDLTDIQKPFEPIPRISQITIATINYQAYLAIINNNFPEKMGKISI